MPGAPPSDAIVLFDGKDLSHWVQRGRGANAGKPIDPVWKLGPGYFEVVGNSGDLLTREKFGDCQLHVEWASPAPPHGNSQGRGNSGVILMSRYEIQVLDAWENPTYADGQTAAIYGQWPPLVNPARKAGRVEHLRHRLRSAALRGRPGDQAGVCDGVLQRRGGAQPQGDHGRHGLPACGSLHAAREPKSR